MDPKAIIAVAIQLIPEIASFIRSFHASNGTFPSDQQVIDEMNFNANRIKAISDKWLADHPQPLIESTVKAVKEKK